MQGTHTLAQNESWQRISEECPGLPLLPVSQESEGTGAGSICCGLQLRSLDRITRSSDLKVTVCSIVVPPMTTGEMEASACFSENDGDVHGFVLSALIFMRFLEDQVLTCSAVTWK